MLEFKNNGPILAFFGHAHFLISFEFDIIFQTFFSESIYEMADNEKMNAFFNLFIYYKNASFKFLSEKIYSIDVGLHK